MIPNPAPVENFWNYWTRIFLANYFLKNKVIIVMTFQSCFADAPFPAKLIDFMLLWSCVYCQEVKNKNESWEMDPTMISSTLITKVDTHYFN